APDPRQHEKRKEQRDEGGDSNDAHTGRLDLGDEFTPCVAALVVRDVVGSAPEPRVLRNRQDESATRTKRPHDLLQHESVLVDVLEDVERRNHVEDARERHVSRVELQKRRSGQSAARDLETSREQIGARNSEWETARTDPVEYEPRPAADFE